MQGQVRAVPRQLRGAAAVGPPRSADRACLALFCGLCCPACPGSDGEEGVSMSLLYFIPLLMLPMTCMPQNLLIYCNHVPREDSGNCSYAFKALSFLPNQLSCAASQGLLFGWGLSCMLSCARRESWSPVSQPSGGRGRERPSATWSGDGARGRVSGSCAPVLEAAEPSLSPRPMKWHLVPLFPLPPPPDGAAVAHVAPCDLVAAGTGSVCGRLFLAQRAGVVRVCGHTATWLREGRGLLCRGLPGTFFLP